MKKFNYILLLVLITLIGCKEPNPTAPDTEIISREKVSYEVLGKTSSGFSRDSIVELIVENRTQLTNFLTTNTQSPNLDLLDKLLQFDFSENILVIISVKTIGINANIEIDSIYIDANGKFNFAYRVNNTRGIGEQILYPTIAVKFKKRGLNKFDFRRKYFTDGEVPKLNEFQTLAVDVPIKHHGKWKLVFHDLEQFKIWANEFSLQDLSFISNVDFDKEAVISVGTGEFEKGEFTYLISEIKQRANSLIVESVLNVRNPYNTLTKSNNHFVKIKKAAIPIDFAPTYVEPNYSNGKQIYFELFKLVTLPTSENSDEEITKVSNIAELFSNVDYSDELSPTNLDMNFEFYDLLIIKSPTFNSNNISINIEKLYLDGDGISGKVVIESKNENNSKKIESYMILKIFKSSQKISKNFEVKIK